jgi:hypothetical protein
VSLNFSVAKMVAIVSICHKGSGANGKYIDIAPPMTPERLKNYIGKPLKDAGDMEFEK